MVTVLSVLNRRVTQNGGGGVGGGGGGLNSSTNYDLNFLDKQEKLRMLRIFKKAICEIKLIMIF